MQPQLTYFIYKKTKVINQTTDKEDEGYNKMYVNGSSSTYNVSFYLQNKSGYLSKNSHLNKDMALTDSKLERVGSIGAKDSFKQNLSNEEIKLLEKMEPVDQEIKKASLSPKNPSFQDKEVNKYPNKLEAEDKATQATLKQEGFKAYGLTTEKSTTSIQSNNGVNDIKSKETIARFEENSKVTLKNSISKFDNKSNISYKYSPMNLFA